MSRADCAVGVAGRRRPLVYFVHGVLVVFMVGAGRGRDTRPGDFNVLNLLEHGKFFRFHAAILRVNGFEVHFFL